MKATAVAPLAQSQMQILCAPRIEANLWVRLLHKPSPFSFEEAFLLCQVSFDEWLAWIPDYGQACLHVNQFECMD
jgi:uncharacterized protein YqcC (DUF446 family)